MNAIYSYKYTPFGGKWFDKNLVNISRLSVIHANKFYNTILYCDKHIKEIIESHNIPFNKIVVLDEIENYKGMVYSIPKIYAMMYQSEPYIHLDFDTVVLHKLPLNSTITFAYPEVQLKPNVTPDQLNYLNNTYFNIFKKYHQSISESYNWDFGIIPNNSVLAVKIPNIVKTIYSEILDFMGEDLVNNMNPQLGLAQYIEQFSLYRKLNESRIDSNFIYDECNFMFNPSMDSIYNNRTHYTKETINLDIVKSNYFIHFANYNDSIDLLNSILLKMYRDLNIESEFIDYEVNKL